MAHAAETLERAEHAGHAGHGHGGHGGAPGEPPDPLPTWIGITMALLGVLLAVAAARVGFERAELVQYLVDQQHAHAKYQAQDIKHRTALLSLRQLHALSSNANANVNKEDMVLVAKSVERYFGESAAAQKWVESYDAVIAAHADAQEEYEHGQLAAELGIVIASIALLLRRKSAWAVSLLLGATAIVVIVITYTHTSHRLHDADAKIEAAEKAYHSLREAGKSTEIDKALVDEVLGQHG